VPDGFSRRWMLEEFAHHKERHRPFTANVWLGTAYINKVCQFVKPGSGLKYAWLSTDKVALTMSLWVHDV
jgi:hypothetical protein